MAQNQQCQLCGATILPEHVDQGRAGRWAGQLLCTTCYAAKRGLPTAPKAVAPPARPAGGVEPLEVEAMPVDAAGPVGAIPRPVPPAAKVEADEPISLVDSGEAESAPTKIQAMGGSKIQQQRKQFKRKTNPAAPGATRVRTFHSKIQAESIEYMDVAINEWLNDNPDVVVKFATTSIGLMAGKFPEPNIILNIWY